MTLMYIGTCVLLQGHAEKGLDKWRVVSLAGVEAWKEVDGARIGRATPEASGLAPSSRWGNCSAIGRAVLTIPAEKGNARRVRS